MVKKYIICLIVLFFLFLIIKHLFDIFSKPTVIEGATGEIDTSSSNNEMILADQNAADISSLKDKVNELLELKDQVQNNTDQISKNDDKITSLMNSLTPSSQEDSQENQDLIDQNPDTFNL
jgi:hypothetical protein